MIDEYAIGYRYEDSYYCYKHRVFLKYNTTTENCVNIYYWCVNEFGVGNFWSCLTEFGFDNKIHAEWFMLRWL